MTLRLTDTIVYPSRGSVEEAMAYAKRQGAKRQDFLLDYFTELYRLCKTVTFDAAILVSQSANETGSWRSAIWQQYGNPAGLAVTNSQNLSVVYKTGAEAARAHVVHMWAYRYGRVPKGSELAGYIALDGHYNEVFTTNDTRGNPLAASVKTIGDFNVNGRWALLDRTNTPTGPLDDYGNRIVSDGCAVWPNLPDQTDPPVTTPSTPEEPIPGEQETPVATYNYDNGVEPPWVDYPVADGKKYAGYIAAKDHFIAACVIHSAYGGLQGSTSWFQGGNALTDAMVGNSFDGNALDGQLRRFNDAYGGRYAWASGPVSSPIDDAAKFLEIFGPDKEVVNMYTTALERSCAANVATNAVTEKEHAARVAWVAYHANRYGKRVKEKTGKDGFTCDTFPLIPAENNRSFIIYHGEINSGKRNTCPDPLVRQTIDRLIADVRTVLAGWQLGATTIPPVTEEPMPTYAPVKAIDALQAYKGKDADAVPAYVKSGSDTFVFVNDRVRATKATPRYQTANTDGLKIGQDIAKGEEFAVLWLFWDEQGEPWYISPFWTRVRTNDTERIKDAA